MKVRLLNLLRRLRDAFWLLPALIVLTLAGLGTLAVDIQRAGALPRWLPEEWVYGGGETGARGLLGAVASSTIGVAGTIFSITIAALTLASNQMGPRLLRNFTRDRGNQVTLGVLLGTFAYALVVLRSVQGDGQAAFVPSIGVTGALTLAACCIGVLIYFVHHVATRINVDTVVDLVHAELLATIERLPASDGCADPPCDDVDWSDAVPLRLDGFGYVQDVDFELLASWLETHGGRMKLLVRPGNFVMPGEWAALRLGPPEGGERAVRQAVVLGQNSVAAKDLTFPVRQLVEVAVRALSPGVNDPLTAINVIDRLAAALALLAQRRLSAASGPVVIGPTLTYAELVGGMFDMIRQSAGQTPAVLLHLMDMLARLAPIETDEQRRIALRAFAGALNAEGELAFANPHDREALARSYRRFLASTSRAAGPAAA